MQYLTRTTCRVCGSDNLVELFSLGEQYVSDFVEKDKVFAGPKVPITLDLCNACTLVQARHSLPPENLYGQKYWYKSGTTATMRKALHDVVLAAGGCTDMKPGDVVLDVGSNDGTLLRFWGDGLVRVGVEPAPNLTADYKKEGLLLINDLWSFYAYEAGWEAAHEVDGDPSTEGIDAPKAKVITACGMFYDLDDPNQFIADVAKVLHPEGVFIAQLMCLKQMVLKYDVGNLAHEHLEFYTLKSLERLLSRHGLGIFDIEENEVNGGSYRLYIGHQGLCPYLTAERWDRVLTALKVEAPLVTEEAANDFYSLADSNRNNCVDAIRNIVRNGKRVMVYGASTKGNVILQFYGLDASLIEAAADRDPAKHGLYTVGTGIPIISEEEARRLNPDYFLILPYAFVDEFIVREKAWRDGGGKFIVPLPEFKVV